MAAYPSIASVPVGQRLRKQGARTGEAMTWIMSKLAALLQWVTSAVFATSTTWLAHFQAHLI